MKKHKGKILVLFLAVLLVSVMSCENPFLKKMLVEEEKGKTVPEKPQPQEPANPENPAGSILSTRPPIRSTCRSRAAHAAHGRWPVSADAPSRSRNSGR